MSTFEDIFGRPPEAMAQAPGRVNLLGEHTDYNDGYVLPVAIPQVTQVRMARSEGSAFRVVAEPLGWEARFTLGDLPSQPFARYVYGCLKEVQGTGLDVPPMDILIRSDVPMGVGLSSSAALEVSMLRAVRTLLNAPFDDVRVAQLAQAAEIRHAGVRCGIMDQMASSLADTAHALFLDTRSLVSKRVALPSGTALLVLDSGISRSLAGSAYNERRQECERAAHLLRVKALRDVEDLSAVSALPAPLDRRARHVVTENQRVLRAVEPGVSAAEFGELMNDSHESLRDDFEVSVPALDDLVSRLQRQRGVFGARLTGAGFGGACVALCDAKLLPSIADPVLADYATHGGQGRVLVPPSTID